MVSDSLMKTNTVFHLIFGINSTVPHAPNFKCDSVLVEIGELEILPERLKITSFRALHQGQWHVKAGHFNAIAIVDFDLFLTVGRKEGLIFGVFRADPDRDLFVRPDHQGAKIEGVRADGRNKDRFELGMHHRAARGK